MAETWNSGDAYERYVGRWSRLVARQFLDWLNVGTGRDWLDVGCGTGELTRAILADHAPGAITGIDQSAAHISYARDHTSDSRAVFHAADAQALDLPDAAVDVAVSGLVLNFVPRPERAVVEMARVTRPGGIVAAYVWDYAGQMQMMRAFWDAAVALDATARDQAEDVRFALCRPDALRALFENAGLREVTFRSIDIPTHFRDFDDYWLPFLGGQGPAPGYTMSLSEDARTALRERLRATLPTEPDGAIDLWARAWAVRGAR